MLADYFLSDKTEISAYSIEVNRLHSKLHNEVGIDIDEDSSTVIA